MNNIYVIPHKSGYIGEALIAAPDAETANQMIIEFKESDPHNERDSFGYDFVDESDVLPAAQIPHSGIIHHGIVYLPL